MKQLIFNALAYKESYDTSTQLIRKNRTLDTYLKNSIVSLSSAKIHNPNCDVVLFANFEVPENFLRQFSQANIRIIRIPFEDFVMAKEYTWSLAFYKLAALKYAVQNLKYDYYILLDTDTFTVASYDDIWKDCNDGIMLFNVNHRVSNRDRSALIKSYQAIHGQTKYLQHYGGEFIAGMRRQLASFLFDCEQEYKGLCQLTNNIDRNSGDEYIISVAASKNPIINANSYICRYWTGRFYLVSTNYFYNSVDIWHLPHEKEYGMMRLYKYYTTKGSFPSNSTCARICSLPPKSVPLTKLLSLAISRLFLKK